MGSFETTSRIGLDGRTNGELIFGAIPFSLWSFEIFVTAWVIFTSTVGGSFGLVNTKRSNSESIIIGDRRRLEMLFKNIIDNAFEHGHKEKSVEVRISNLNDNVQIFVRNFEGLQRGGSTPNAPIKFGIGLMLSDSIAKAHNGHLELSYAVAGGVEAKVLIPILRSGNS